MKSDTTKVPFCLGLTGGIGCGKSTVANLFAKLGAGIVDTDEISHQLTQTGGGAIAAIRTAFGDAFIRDDGALDREKMRGLIFSTPTAKQKLENILHPMIQAQALAKIQTMLFKPYIIIVVPLLPESPAFQQFVRRILVVDCDEESQVARVMSRNGINEAEIRAIISNQSPRSERLNLADDVIYNDGGINNLAAQVDILHRLYLLGN